MHSNPTRGSKFDTNTIFVEMDRVESGGGFFGFMTESGTIAGLSVGDGSRSQLDPAKRRHKQDVPIIGNAGAAQVCVTEAKDRAVGIMISTARVPSLDACIRTQLDHPERERGAGKGMPVRIGSDKRIDEAGGLETSLLAQEADRDNQNQEE